MKSTFTRLLPALAVMMTAGSAYVQAETLTPDQALSRAMQTESRARMKSAHGTVSPSLVLTQTTGGEPTVYVFSSGDGYMVLSANDVAPAILGYGDNLNQINPEMKWWLEEYGRQIEWAANSGQPTVLSAQSASVSTDYEAIAPMTATRWNQDAPFNNDCPEVSGTRCVTGCVATALAQIMKYHNWPQTGTGSNSYTCSATGSTLSVDFANTTYDWDDMLNVYTSSATSTENAAVANLMYSCGVAVNMDYTTSESSATSFAAAQAMVNYFKYDKGITFYSRSYYSIDDWNALVYNQLKQYGPVQYSGQSNDGGHSFVCDGYSGDGYFHINWGWGGMSDGYFLLTALNPTSQGIGGSTSGYNFDQDIIGNVKPEDGTTTAIVPNMVAQEFYPSSSTVSLGNEAYFEGPVYSYSLASVSGNLGVKLTDASGNVTYVKGNSFSEMQPEYGVSGFYVTFPSTLAQGSYSISPAVADTNGNWYDIPVLVGAARTESMTVSNGVITFDETAAATVTVSDVDLKTDFYIGANYEIGLTVTNTGSQEYLGGIRLMLINSSDQAVAEGEEYPLDLTAGESTDVTYISGWTAASNTTLSAGQYYICFVDDSGNQLSDMQTVTLNAQSSPTLSLSDFTITGGTTVYNKSNIEFTGTLEVSDGYFGNTLTLVIFPYETGGGSVTSVATYSTEPFFMSAGQSQQFSVTADFSNGTEGKQYFAMFYQGSNPAVDNRLVFKLSSDSDGVTDVENSNAVETTEYYDLNGVRLNAGNLNKGLYIVRTVMTDGTANIDKTVIR